MYRSNSPWPPARSDENTSVSPSREISGSPLLGPIVLMIVGAPNALDVLRQVRQALGDRVLLGAGTVLDPETARAVLLAGAQYIVAPTVNLDVIRLCQRYDKLVMPGAFSPTEVLTPRFFCMLSNTCRTQAKTWRKFGDYCVRAGCWSWKRRDSIH